MRIPRKLHEVTRAFFSNVILDDFNRGKIDLKSLPKGMRRYVIACLAILGIGLICTIVLYFRDRLLPGIAYSYNDITYTISFLSLAISLTAFTLGWAFLLMGGIWSNIIMFSVIVVYFAYLPACVGLSFSHLWWFLYPLLFIIMLLVLSLKQSSWVKSYIRIISLLLVCLLITFLGIFVTPFKRYIPKNIIFWILGILTILMAFLVSAISVYLKRRRFAEKRLIRTGVLIFAGTAFMFLTIFLRRDFQIKQFTEILVLVFDRTLAYISLFWFILGFSALWQIISWSEWARDALEILFPKKIIFALVFIFWAGIIFLNVYPLKLPDEWEFTLFYANLAVLLFLIMLFRNFTVPRILSLFQWTIFVLLVVSSYNSILIETVSKTDFNWISFMMFIVGITWLLFQGSGFILNNSGRWFSRTSRLFLFFGLIFIMLGVNNFMLVTRFEQFMKTVKISAFMGFVYTGPPFILYIWFVKRLKRHPVNPLHLAYLFIWGAVLVHPVILLQKILLAYQMPIIILFFITAVVQEYVKLYVIRKITYGSSFFNELIDGIIYASAIGLGWIIFMLNPQFDLLPIKNISGIINIPPHSMSFLCLFFLQFACAGFLGYGLSKTKLAGIAYNEANIFFVRPLFTGWTLAVLYRGVIEFTVFVYIFAPQLVPYQIIRFFTGLSLGIAIFILWLAQKSRRVK